MKAGIGHHYLESTHCSDCAEAKWGEIRLETADCYDNYGAPVEARKIVKPCGETIPQFSAEG